MASKQVEKTRARLERRIEEGLYYEAHQQLRVVSQRYVKSQNFDAAIEILCTGAQSLLRANQGASGGDLCLLLVDVYRTAKLYPSNSAKLRLFELATEIPRNEPSRKRFINESIAWNAKFGPYPAGDPEIHHLVGNLFALEHDVYEAEKHLVLGTKKSPDVLASMLFEWYQQDQFESAALYISRAVFSYLLVGNIYGASRSLDVFLDHLYRTSPGLVSHTAESKFADLRIIPSLPLINFLNLFVAAAQCANAELFKYLRSHYVGRLNTMSGWTDALEQLGEMYFGLQIRRQHNIMDLVGGLFGGPPSAVPTLKPGTDLD